MKKRLTITHEITSPFEEVLINERNDTFSFNPQNKNGQELSDFLSNCKLSPAISELWKEMDFYKKAHDLAMELNRTSPCDPDITEEQIQAHKEYRSFVEDNLHIINKIKDNE